MTTATRRDGFGLPAALLAIVVVGALVTGGLYTAMSEDRNSGNAQFGNHAYMAAERGIEDIFGTRTRPYFETIPVGQADTIGPVAITIDNVQAQYTVVVQRLNTLLFKVESEGEVTSGGRYAGSSRRLAQMMRINYTYVPKDRAYTTQGMVRIRGQSYVNGADTVPDTWSDCVDEGSKTGIVSIDTTTIDIPPGGGGNKGVGGTPEKQEDATLDSLKFIEYGDMHLDDLKKYADKPIPPGTYSGMAPVVDGAGECDKSQLLNWGDPDDPSGACHLYWPIIYSQGDLHLSGGRGQGILIVEGELSLSGNFEFAGIVFIYKNIQASGTGNKIYGTVNILGSDASDLGMTGAGNTQVRLSTCAIERAHRYADRFARPIPLGERKFVDISALGVD